MSISLTPALTGHRVEILTTRLEPAAGDIGSQIRPFLHRQVARKFYYFFVHHTVGAVGMFEGSAGSVLSPVSHNPPLFCVHFGVGTIGIHFV